jgi:hypothetical protein
VLTPTPEPGGRGVGLLLGLGVAALVLIGAAWLFITTGGDPAEPDDVVTEAPPEPLSSDDNDVGRPDERGVPSKAPAGKAPARAATPASPATPPAPAPSSSPELRVSSDVPGAMVFLDRKYLGTTPLVSRDVTPGSHQLNVQVEGVEPVVQTVEIADDGPTSVNVTLTSRTLNARVPVVHKHRIGSCEGTLIASSSGLRYQTTHPSDGFSFPLAQLETFTVNYAEKNLRVKQRGGRTWNFTTPDDSADPLLVFHREVEQAR